jgi:ATP-dependent DNA helicase RecG
MKLQLEESGKAGIADYMGHKSVSGELNRQIKHLLNLGWIEMTLPEKPTSRLQRYRLTNLGRAMVTHPESQDEN